MTNMQETIKSLKIWKDEFEFHIEKFDKFY